MSQAKKTRLLKEAILDLHQAHPSTERLRIQGHLENLRAIVRHARGEDCSDQLRTIAAHGKEQPFSDYGAY